MKIEKADERAVIQILRGIAIVLVVIHHVMKCFSLSNELNTLLTIINTVHVVVFFVISGWLFEKKKCKYRKNGIFLFLKKKFCQLIVPYMTFSFSFAILIWLGSHIEVLKQATLSKWLIITDKYKPIEYIGDMSYDIYLIHNPWIVSTLSIILKNRVTIPLAIVIGTIMTIVISVTVITVIKCYLNPIYKVYLQHTFH